VNLNITFTVDVLPMISEEDKVLWECVPGVLITLSPYKVLGTVLPLEEAITRSGLPLSLSTGDLGSSTGSCSVIIGRWVGIWVPGKMNLKQNLKLQCLWE